RVPSARRLRQPVPVVPAAERHVPVAASIRGAALCAIALVTTHCTFARADPAPTLVAQRRCAIAALAHPGLAFLRGRRIFGRRWRASLLGRGASAAKAVDGVACERRHEIDG